MIFVMLPAFQFFWDFSLEHNLPIICYSAANIHFLFQISGNIHINLFQIMGNNIFFCFKSVATQKHTYEALITQVLLIKVWFHVRKMWCDIIFASQYKCIYICVKQVLLHQSNIFSILSKFLFTLLSYISLTISSASLSSSHVPQTEARKRFVRSRFVLLFAWDVSIHDALS